MSKSATLWSDAIYRLTRNKAAMFGAFILLILIASAALAPWIAPYSCESTITSVDFCSSKGLTACSMRLPHFSFF